MEKISETTTSSLRSDSTTGDPSTEQGGLKLGLSEFARWLASKDASERYDYTDAANCALAQFLKSRGDKNYCLSPFEIPKAIDRVIVLHPQTFGAALNRARDAIAKATGAA